MLAARGMIVRLLHQRQNCLRALFLDECRSGVSLTLRETPQLIEKVHQSVVFSADERVYTIGALLPNSVHDLLNATVITFTATPHK